MGTLHDDNIIGQLTTVQLPEEVHEVRPGLKVTVRALTRDEVLTLQEYGQKEETSNAQYEQSMLALALVSPKMTKNQIKAWQKASVATEIDGVVRRVMRLSGMIEDSVNEAYKSVRDEPEPGE